MIVKYIIYHYYVGNFQNAVPTLFPGSCNPSLVITLIRNEVINVSNRKHSLLERYPAFLKCIIMCHARSQV